MNKRGKSSGLFDVRGNPIAKHQTVHLQKQAQFFTSKDKAAQYRAANPDWRDVEKYMMVYNRYIDHKVEFEDAVEAIVHKFSIHYRDYDSDAIQKLLGVIVKTSGIAALELFMEECTKRNMRVEYTKPGEKAPPNSVRIGVETNDEEVSGQWPVSQQAAVNYIELYTAYVLNQATFEEARKAILYMISASYSEGKYDDAKAVLNQVKHKEGEGVVKKLVEDCDEIGGKMRSFAGGGPRHIPEPTPGFKGRLVDFLTSHGDAMKKASFTKNEAAVDNVVAILSNCPRYVINKRVSFLCSDVANHGKLQGTKAPSGLMWMETEPMEGGTLGFVWVGEGEYLTVEEGVAEADLQRGRLVIFMRHTDVISYSVELTLGEEPVFGDTYTEAEKRWPEDKRAMMRRQAADQCRLFAAFCMLMSAPKTHTTEHVEFDRLNRQRVKNSKPPLNSYTSVKLSVDGPISRAGGACQIGPGDPTTERTGKRLHFVGHFWRTRLGKLEFVRPHWRGDPSLGRVEGRMVR